MSEVQVTSETTFGRLDIGAYEIEDCGEDNSQYFPGRGVAYTDWDNVFVGVGDDAAQALEDACENAAQFGYDTASVDSPLHMDLTSAHTDCDPGDDDEHDWQHYVALYVKRAIA